MLKMYTGYKCRTCKLEFVLLTEDVNMMAKDLKENIGDDLRECMKERSYKRIKGAIKQVR